MAYELAHRFREWADKNGMEHIEGGLIAYAAVITYLAVNGLISEDKAIAYLTKEAPNG